MASTRDAALGMSRESMRRERMIRERMSRKRMSKLVRMSKERMSWWMVVVIELVLAAGQKTGQYIPA